MPTKVQELAAAIRGTMPPEGIPPFNVLVDPLVRVYADTMAGALIGPLPAVANPPGAPLPPVYPLPPTPPTPGPHLVACSSGPSLPATSDAVKGQIHIMVDGTFHIFSGSAWKTITVT